MGLSRLRAQKKRVIVKTKTPNKLMSQHTPSIPGFEATTAQFAHLLSELDAPELIDHSVIEETAYRLGWEVIRQAIEEKLQKGHWAQDV